MSSAPVRGTRSPTGPSGPSPPAGEARTLAPFGRRLGKVVAAEAIGPYRLISVEDAGGPTDPRPGQFYMIAAEGGWGAGRGERPYLPRAFSFCRAVPRQEAAAGGPAEDPQLAPPGGGGGAVLGFLSARVGPGTERLETLHPGEGLWLMGPLGVGFAPATDRRPLLVAGGIGVAPILGLEDALGAAGPRRAAGPCVLLGFRSAAHAEAARLFAGAPAVATDDGSIGHHGPVTELLRAELVSGPEAAVYACGPQPMLEAVRALCAELRVPAQLALESGMACGFGACFGCVVPTRKGFLRLCVDGPVLDAGLLDTATMPGGPH